LFQFQVGLQRLYTVTRVGIFVRFRAPLQPVFRIGNQREIGGNIGNHKIKLDRVSND
jgi:hypothetical protein